MLINIDFRALAGGWYAVCLSGLLKLQTCTETAFAPSYVRYNHS